MGREQTGELKATQLLLAHNSLHVFPSLLPTENVYGSLVPRPGKSRQLYLALWEPASPPGGCTVPPSTAPPTPPRVDALLPVHSLMPRGWLPSYGRSGEGGPFNGQVCLSSHTSKENETGHRQTKQRYLPRLLGSSSCCSSTRGCPPRRHDPTLPEWSQTAASSQPGCT